MLDGVNSFAGSGHMLSFLLWSGLEQAAYITDLQSDEKQPPTLRVFFFPVTTQTLSATTMAQGVRSFGVRRQSEARRRF
jgi:hypothetical protein